MQNQNTFISAISKTEFPCTEKVFGNSIRKPILAIIKKAYPNFDANDCIANSELNSFRAQYISQFLETELGELTQLETFVKQSLNEDELVVGKLEDQHNDFTIGQKVADKVASFGGSWTFIIAFGIFILIWICINIYVLTNKGFDPFPFILLNLILSCLAALQAPVIMMSQNRQEEKDRDRAKKDYMINLKSEMEIRMLHEKIDHLIMHQQQELIQIQKVQIDMMNDILAKIKS